MNFHFISLFLSSRRLGILIRRGRSIHGGRVRRIFARDQKRRTNRQTFAIVKRLRNVNVSKQHRVDAIDVWTSSMRFAPAGRGLLLHLSCWHNLSTLRITGG
jgi:hypothetical protein